MGYQQDDKGIRGFGIEGELVCPDCIEDEELEEMTERDILTENAIGQKEYFCVRCKRKLQRMEEARQGRTRQGWRIRIFMENCNVNGENGFELV